MNHRATWPRYAGLFGPAVGLGMMAAGIGKPDYSGLDAAWNLVNNRSARLADYRGIGDYIAYRPMDVWQNQNRMAATSGATNRAIANTNNPSRGALQLSAGLNAMMADADLYSKALEYNNNRRRETGEFNRHTNEFNANAYNNNAATNAQILNNDLQFRGRLATDIARTKLDSDAGWYNSLYGNVAGLFKGLSDLGRENFAYNQAVDTLGSGAYPGVTREKLIDAGLGRYVTPEEYERLMGRRDRRGLTL